MKVIGYNKSTISRIAETVSLLLQKLWSIIAQLSVTSQRRRVATPLTCL